MVWLYSCGQAESNEPTQVYILEDLTLLGNGVESVLNEDDFLENPNHSDFFIFLLAWDVGLGSLECKESIRFRINGIKTKVYLSM